MIVFRWQLNRSARVETLSPLNRACIIVALSAKYDWPLLPRVLNFLMSFLRRVVIWGGIDRNDKGTRYC